jgi:hypothetical protein
MRGITIFCLVLLLSGFAVAQATVIGGYANNWPTAYGVYAIPFVPRVTTPSVALETVSPSAVGASNATFGNVAGATNATLSIVNAPPAGVFTTPVWYGPEAAPPAAPPVIVSTGGHMRMRMEKHEHRHHRSAEIGPAPYESTVGAATLLAGAGPAKKASKTYTNEDIERFNQATGTVKYDGKTEQIK